MARGEAGSGSDIDLLIVAVDLDSSELHARLAELISDMRSWTGNEAQVVEHSLASWRKVVRTKNPLVEQIRLDGIPIAGATASLLERRR